MVAEALKVFGLDEDAHVRPLDGGTANVSFVIDGNKTDCFFHTMTPKTYYIALYNELFINGQRDIGDNRSVAFFDRNRFYSGIGYVIKPGYKVQLGVMKQTTNTWAKRQLQFSFHHSF
mgnify:CR=1 FL=1